MPIRITGLNSGLDTEALVSELVSAYRLKTQKYTKAQTKLSWKQEAWKDLNSKVSSFYSKLTSLRYSSAYNVRSTTISDSTKATVSASSSAINGTYSVKIKQIARSGYLTGGELKEGVTASSKLSDLGYDKGNGTITVTAGGKTTDIAVSNDMTISEFVMSLNDAGVKANYDSANNRIFVASSMTGADGDFSLTGTDVQYDENGNILMSNGTAALNALGLNVASEANTEMYKDWAAYALNKDGEAYFTFSYDEAGKLVVQKNGIYSKDKTEANIESLLLDVQSASTTITNNTAQIAYAKAYKTVAEAGLTEQEIKEFQALTSEKDLENVYIDADGNIYDQKADGGTYVRREDGEKFTPEELTDASISLTSGKDHLLELQKEAGLTKEVEKEVKNEDGSTTTTTEIVADDEKVAAYKSALSTKAAYEVKDEAGEYKNKNEIAKVVTEYNNNTLDTFVEDLQSAVDAANKVVKDNPTLNDASFKPGGVKAKIANAVGVLNGDITIQPSTGATRIDGQDALIEINGAEYASTSNQITVNGMTVTALAETGDNELTVTVANNTQGLYDKIKEVLNEYNTLINEMTKLYNADSVKGYEPLTDEEKDAMSDTEVEKWEEKIKNSLLRRDDTLSSLISGLTSCVYKSYTIDGKSYSLSSFGIHTMGVLYSEDNEENALHIDGNADDDLTSGNTDKLMAMLNSDPDTVVDFMKQFTSGLYDTINKKMSSSTLSSFNVVYNDKEMAREYSDYTDTINKWEEKLQKIEDSYYKKFAAMESALATLQAQQSSLANLLGM